MKRATIYFQSDSQQNGSHRKQKVQYLPYSSSEQSSLKEINFNGRNLKKQKKIKKEKMKIGNVFQKDNPELQKKLMQVKQKKEEREKQQREKRPKQFKDFWGAQDPFQYSLRKVELNHWSMQEDCLLLEKVLQQGKHRRWQKIIPYFVERTRTYSALKNRYVLLMDRLQNSIADGKSMSEEELTTKYLKARKDCGEYRYEQLGEHVAILDKQMQEEEDKKTQYKKWLQQRLKPIYSEKQLKRKQQLEEKKQKRMAQELFEQNLLQSLSTTGQVLDQLIRRKRTVSRLIQIGINILKNRNRRTRQNQYLLSVKKMAGFDLK